MGGSASLPLPVTLLKIDGTTVDPSTGGVVVDEWSWDYDGDGEASITEWGPGVGQSPTYVGGQIADIYLDSTLRFSGEITSASSQYSDGWTHTYRARGWKYRLNVHVPITAVDGSGRMMWNTRPDDDDDIQANDGQSVGDILDSLLDQHATALTALGVTTDATTASQLAALTLVPNEPVYLTGRFAQAVETVLRAWAKNVVFHVTPAGKVRFLDTTAAGTVLTLTEGDRIGPTRWRYDISDTATRVLVRGRAMVYPFYASLLSELLVPAWDAGQEEDWSLADFETPSDAYDEGAVDSITSATTIEVDPTDAATAWPANFWSGRQAWIYLYWSGGTGITFSEQRPVTACDALTAGGTATITVAFPLDNAGTNAYDTYKLIGRSAPLDETTSDADRVDVYRLYTVDDPGHLVADHLVKRFPTSVPFLGYYGDSSVQVLHPTALIVRADGATIPASFKILPDTGQIRFDRPVVEACNPRSTLQAGGAAVVQPGDLWVLLAYSRGALEAPYPADSGGDPVYSGAAFDDFDIERTVVVDIDGWQYEGNRSIMEEYAEMLHKSLSEPGYEGTVRVLGAYSEALDGGALLRVAIAGDGYTTGQDAIENPVRGFRLRYHHDGRGGMLHSTELRCSTRRNPATGDRHFIHPTELEACRFKLPTGLQFDLRGGGEGLRGWQALGVTGDQLQAQALEGNRAAAASSGDWTPTGNVLATAKDRESMGKAEREAESKREGPYRDPVTGATASTDKPLPTGGLIRSTPGADSPGAVEGYTAAGKERHDTVAAAAKKERDQRAADHQAALAATREAGKAKALDRMTAAQKVRDKGEAEGARRAEASAKAAEVKRTREAKAKGPPGPGYAWDSGAGDWVRRARPKGT